MIALSDAAVAILACYQRGLPRRSCSTAAGAPTSPSTSRAVARIAEAAGLPATITLHSLRHGVGSALADAGLSAMQVAIALGHASTRTSERYCHAVDGARAVLAQRAAELVRPTRLRVVG